MISEENFEEDILNLATSVIKKQCLSLALRMGIFDSFSREGCNSDEVSKKLGINPSYGFRWYRALAGLGFLKDHGNRKFSITNLGWKMRKDGGTKIPYYLLLKASDPYMESWKLGNIEKQMKGDGEDKNNYSFFHGFGMSLWEYFEKNRYESEMFNHGMTGYTEYSKPQLIKTLQKLDFLKESKIVCDIAGGNGFLIAQILELYENLEKGIIMEIQSVVEKNENLIKINEKMEYRVGDFFKPESIPKSMDVYFFKRILHDWDDEKSVQILKSVHEVAEVGSMVCLVEKYIPEIVETGKNCQGVMMDIQMLVLFGDAKERTVKEYGELMRKSGWVYERTLVAEDDSFGIFIGIKK